MGELSPRRSGCEECGRPLWFAEREVFFAQICRRCAVVRGFWRMADHNFVTNVTAWATTRPPWWRWTCWLYYAIQSDESDKLRGGT